MSREAMQIALAALEANLGNWAAKTKAVEVLLQALETKREWVGLTAYEIQEIHLGNQHWGSFACAIEQALKEKNNG